MKRYFFLLILIMSLPIVAWAALPQQVQSDFAVIDGAVVMAINDDYIVDLDVNDNLHVGDILTVVKEGKPIIHPVSKEVIRIEVMSDRLVQELIAGDGRVIAVPCR